MFGDIFDTEEELLTGTKEGNVQTSWERMPRNCAQNLPFPEKQRKTGYPIGLKNQGATCYLNSLIQALFFTSQFRQLILSLPLCDGSVDKFSNFLSNQSKIKFLLGFQKLFSEMMIKDALAVSTQHLTKAFGWQGAQHLVQQDMQQAMRIIFDKLQSALSGTEYSNQLTYIFKGVYINFKQCKNCTIKSERFEEFFDINLQVKNLASVNQSLFSLLTAQSMQGPNQVTCDTCQSKQDHWLGKKIKELPNNIVFALSRFQFDYEKMDRVKVNSFFQFDLETPMGHFIQSNKDQTAPQNYIYQLYAVIIHTGSAHGGHYFCYVRDIMQQSNWKQSLEDKKIMEEKSQTNEKLTQEQIKKKQQRKKNQKTYELKQPENKSLLQNWYELNDSSITGINCQKITTKYQGSDSAYILFYRKANVAPPKSIKVPEYFSKIINEENQKVKSDRENYENQKKFIILKINQEPYKLLKNTKISEIMDKFCPFGLSLVNCCTHNGLPYYPMQLSSLQQYKQEDTLQSLQIIHQSQWKAYLIEDEEYQQIQGTIGKDKLPFEVNLIINNNNKKITLFQNQDLASLRKKLEKQYKIPYQKQVIKLVTPYKEAFLTDDLSNDDINLIKLGLINQAQIYVKILDSKKSQTVTKIQVQQQNTLFCFVVERDDQNGIKRIYFDKEKTLQELLEHIMKIESMSSTQKRRLRNMQGDRLFYIDHYSIKLIDLKLQADMIKLRIEKGQIPIKGDICVKIKMQSQYQKPQTPEEIQRICDPNTTIGEVKKMICQENGLQPTNHKLYLTDWMLEPVRPLVKENYTIFDASFGREQTVCLRDNQSPIASQLLHFEINIVKAGSAQYLDNKATPLFIKTKQNKTILELKEQILALDEMKDKGLKPKQIRLRQIKRDYMFGSIWKQHDQQLKNITINNHKLALQIMDKEEQLTENQIVLWVKLRDAEKRSYGEGVEVIFNAGNYPKIEDLKNCLKANMSIENDIKMAKYFHYNFEWVQISEKTIGDFIKNRSQKQTNKKDKGKKENKSQQNPKKKQAKKQENLQDKKQTEIQIKEYNQKQQTKTDTIEDKKKQKKQQGSNQDKPKNKQKQQPKQNTTSKPPNQNKKQKQPKEVFKQEDCYNLRKPPVLLKDGDWIGYGLTDLLAKDDLQTDEDLSLRMLKQEEKMKPGKKPRLAEVGFKINLDF